MSSIDLNSTFTLIATITPAPGKKDEVQSALLSLIDFVQANEPDVLHYTLHFHDESSDFVFVEWFKDMEALDKHGKTDFMREFKERGEKEALVVKHDLRILKGVVGGFAR
ncbi:hypothetical protein K469DRAFT_752062 [Zopfia rhizophila CBS 207.26]|uniref:ABM domain-containing protein n=1 Tax=Zopfia rhizophila CBS 207.26 TaxID=1314779 RepID=A0A6A6DY46_9PEZI|nr:hypothetical protein K469DRAFT_752062 [Zopfia rhizophila CBS 207.26]